MSRPIAYNASGPLSGSIRGGSVNYTVDSGNRDYTTFASKKWVPSADGAAPIVFVTDTYTQGITNQATAVPLFYSCNGTGSAAIIYTANRIPGSPGNYSDANVALNDLINARGYFILESNDPFEGVDADGLALDLDAAKMSSYPQVGTNWIDLSGNGNTGALTNGPTWISSSGSFSFDGVDDYVDVSNNDGFGTAGIAPVATLGFTANLQRKAGGGVQFQQVAGFRNGGTYEFFFLLLDVSGATVDTEARLVTNGGIYDINVPFTSYFDKWTRVDFVANSNRTDLYFNGNLVGSNTSVSGIFQATSGVFRIGLSPAGAYPTKGLIQDTRFYSRALSQTEIKQNYFGSPIVTDGLVFAVDANNIVSYPKSGTAWYGLTGSYSASLVNGPTFDPSNGGSIVFDGVDDQATTNVPGQSTATLMAWVYPYTSSDASGLYFEGIIDNDTPGLYGQGFGPNGSTYGAILDDTFWGTGVTVDLNAWQLVAMSFNSNTAKFYKNGVEAASFSYTQGALTSTNYLIGKSNANAQYFNGKIANAKIYNRALSAAEIQQNYQAEQYRFETPAGPVTNGLVLNFDASNLDSYPGTGNTWYTLAGSDNGTLINGPSFSTEAGGCIVFDGVDDYVSFGNPLDQSQLAQVWTVQAWINITTKPAQILVEGLANNLWIEYYQGNNSLLYLNGGANDYYTYGGQFTAQGWVLATFRFNNANGDRQIWRNLSNISTGGPNSTSTPGGQSSTFTIGSNSSSTILGKIGNVLFYNRYLSDAEITQNYNATKAKFGL